DREKGMSVILMAFGSSGEVLIGNHGGRQ
ncbi:hypothetical protein CCACVL1_25445, partial [Corchorus capsularis]